MKHTKLTRVILLVMLVSLLPVGAVLAFANANVPPADMFQLPWDLGIAWYAIDGIDNTSKRPATSSHNYSVGGAIDFAPKVNMIKGEDTSNYWVTAAAAGTVTEMSSCYIVIDHGNGWSTHYYFLANIQVQVGSTVARNQRLGIIADGVRNKFCPGSQEINIPHLHFMLRPTIIGATFAGWTVNYNWYYNFTTFTKNGTTVGLYKPLLNTMDDVITPTPTDVTPTPTGPYISTTTDLANIDVGTTTLVTVRLNNVPTNGYTSVEITCPFDSSLLETSNITVSDLFGTDPAIAINGPQNGSFIVAVAGSLGNKATTSGTAFTFDAKGLQAGQVPLECTARVSGGDNQLSAIPSIGTVLTIGGIVPTSTITPTVTVTPSPTASVTPTSTSTVGDWLTFTNQTYGFRFQYPPQGVIVSGGDDTFTRIDLPFAQGTNLREKYLEMVVAENVSPCQSPLATQSMLETSEVVTINELSFLKQTGGDGAAGNLYQWVAYSIIRDNVCVSLDFILHSLNPGNFPVPPPVFDYAAESAVFGQIASTYAWLPAVQDGTLMGTVIASKPVTVNLYDLDDVLVETVSVNLDGTFTLTLPAGTYTAVASANGFLNAQASVTITGSDTTTLTTMRLPAGDIDGNGIIDQFDALTIGMNYNAAEPSVADLNNDGIINVLDLEALAGNYRKTGPVVWQ
jgi:murein DD-endopeptidase MepM/ murein hydrolase activator NlpD